MNTKVTSTSHPQVDSRPPRLLDFTSQGAQPAPGDEDAIAARWALLSWPGDLKSAIKQARFEARLSAVHARELDAPHKAAARASTLEHLINERHRCRIATKAMSLSPGARTGCTDVTPDALLRSIEPLGWCSADAHGWAAGRPLESVTKDFMTAVGPKAATITSFRAPATGDIHFRCAYRSEGHNILWSLAPKVPMGTSAREAHSILRDLLVNIEREIGMSYAGKLLRSRASHANESRSKAVHEPTPLPPYASRPGSAPA